jgi:hypothetical protein
MVASVEWIEKWSSPLSRAFSVVRSQGADRLPPMPRSNHYLLPGYTHRLPHRCHSRSSLFRASPERGRSDEEHRTSNTEHSTGFLGAGSGGTAPEHSRLLASRLGGSAGYRGPVGDVELRLRRQPVGADADGRRQVGPAGGGDRMARCGGERPRSGAVGPAPTP